MKRALRFFFGNHFVFQLAEWKMKWIPNKEQKKIKINEATEIHKRKSFYSSFINKHDLCYDVGANLGNRITPLLDIGARVVAVEPQESCYQYLKYKFGKKIDIIRKGLGENEGHKDFHISNYSAISSFSNEWINSVKDGRFKGNSWNKVIKVEMTTLDKLIENYGLPAFIKIDVEGYELNVLRGLTKPVKMISFEYTVPEQTAKTIECIDQIEKNNLNIECNYSVGETMVFHLKDWLSAENIRKHIVSPEFCDTGFGDIYVRLKN